MTPRHPVRILILVVKRVGEILVTTPLIRSFKKAFPDGEITVVVDAGYEEVLRDNPYVDRVFTQDPEDSVFAFLKKAAALSRMGFDVSVDVLANPRSAFISLISRAPIRFGPDSRIRNLAYNRTLPSSRESSGFIARERLSAVTELTGGTNETGLDIFIDPPSRNKGEEILKANGIHPGDGFVTLCPVSLRRWKLWSLDDYARVADYLTGELGLRVILVGGPGESRFLNRVENAMRDSPQASIEFDSLKVLAHVLSRSTLHIGNNGGIQYVATAVDLPTITIFGPGRAQVWNDEQNPNRVALWKEMDCRQPGCFRTCPYDFKCLREVTFSDVKGAVDSFFS